MPKINEDSEERLLLNKERQIKTHKVVAILIIVTLGVVALTIILAVTLTQKKKHSDEPIYPNADRRISCLPEGLQTEQHCIAKGCVWSLVLNGPSCYLPSDYGYKVVNSEKTQTQTVYTLEKLSNVSMFGSDIGIIAFMHEELDNNVLHFKFYDPKQSRYEVPVKDKWNFPSGLPKNPRYEVKVYDEEPFSFQIIRTSTKAVLWDTSIGGLTFADKFLQIATLLPSNYIYGFGENHHKSFQHDLKFRTWPMFSRDEVISDSYQANHYGVHPFYTCMENNTGYSHGVLLLNSNAMDYTLQPAPSLILRTIGGVLDFYMFLGPTPENVIQQYTKIVGRSFIPPYWSLGFQISRWGYDSLENMKNVFERNRKAEIPYDIQVADIDYMDVRKDFTYDPVKFSKFPEFINELHNNNMRLIVILDPAIVANMNYSTHQRAMENDVYIKWPKNYPIFDDDVIKANYAMLGWVWPDEKVAFPDFLKESTQDWWINEITTFYQSIKFDGLWIDMNEPSNFGTNQEIPWYCKKPCWSLKCNHSEWDDPPYPTYASIYNKARLSDKTLCMIGSQANGTLRHYDVHSLYGWSESKPTLLGAQNATGKRSVVISRSTYPGSNKYASHWLGDNRSQWPELHHSIIGLLEFNLFGYPYVGADICGFVDDTTEELCSRWQQLGAFYPFCRNHNNKGQRDQDPAIWSSKTIDIIKTSLKIRYSLLPYLYTLFFNHHSRGTTVVRPLFHEFFTDTETYAIDTQFLWGAALLISPVLKKKTSSVNAYFPKGIWYDFYKKTAFASSGSSKHISAPLDVIPLHVRGGYILPMQKPEITTYASRLNNFTLLIALVADDETNELNAEGELFWDDGESIDTYLKKMYNYYSFTFKKNKLQIEFQKSGGPDMSSYYIEKLEFWGYPNNPNSIVFGTTVLKHEYNNTNKVLSVTGELPMTQKLIEIYIRNEPIPTAEELTRIDCGYKNTINETECLNRGCQWNSSHDNINVPSCFYADAGYDVVDIINSTSFMNVSLEMNLKLSRKTKSIDDLREVRVWITTEREDYLRVRIYDPKQSRYEVPSTIIHPTQDPDYNLTYTVKISNVSEPFQIEIIRNSTQQSVWKTIGGLVFKDQLLELTVQLPSTNVYGFGQNNHQSFRHDLYYQTWGMFANDRSAETEGNTNMYGVHPLYICIEPEGVAHGVFFLNSNAMEYKFTPLPSLTLRSLGGIFDFFIYMGPKPDNVVSQFGKMTGFSFSPPYWAFGFQISRHGYNSSKHMKEVIDRNLEAGIPIDAVYADIDYLDNGKDFTYDKINFANLSDFIDNLHLEGIHFMTILDPALIINDQDYEPYKLINDVDGFIKWPNGSNIIGHVWPKGPVAFPDYLNPKTKNITYELIKNYFKTVPFDGFWLDMNEPSNFGTNRNDTEDGLMCPNNELDDPYYKPDFIRGNRLSDKTLCMISMQYPNVSHYNIHNIYGRIQTETIREGFRQAFFPHRPMILSRSTYPGSGTYAGHWLGDNLSTWKHMRQSIIGCLEFNMFLIPYVGANICGYHGDVTEELCERWMQLGSFYIFARNHNSMGAKDQDPAVFSPEVVLSMKQALEMRYTLLPLLNTLFFSSDISDNSIMRPLAFEFPNDVNTLDIDQQFMWMHNLMIAPVLRKGKVEVRVYFPEVRWFDYRNGEEVLDTGRTITVDAPRDIIPVYVQGGSIIPTQKFTFNANFSRSNPFGLVVAPNENGTAQGILFYDDGLSFETLHSKDFHARYAFEEYQLNATVNSQFGEFNYTTLDEIRIFGVPNSPKNVTLNPASLSLKTHFNQQTKELFITDIKHPMNEDFSLTLHN